jgi:hypothetical protein
MNNNKLQYVRYQKWDKRNKEKKSESTKGNDWKIG